MGSILLVFSKIGLELLWKWLSGQEDNVDDFRSEGFAEVEE